LSVALKAASYHKAVPGFEDVEEGGHGGDGHHADEEGGVEGAFGGGFFGLHGVATFGDGFRAEGVEEGDECPVSVVAGEGAGHVGLLPAYWTRVIMIEDAPEAVLAQGMAAGGRNGVQ